MNFHHKLLTFVLEILKYEITSKTSRLLLFFCHNFDFGQFKYFLWTGR